MSDLIPLRTITLAAAQRLLAAGVARAGELGVPVCITICDVAGDPVLSARMDGAPRLSAQLATDKAWTVTSFNGLPTKAWWGLIGEEQSLVHGITKTPRLTVFGGGVPVLAGAELVGAVGVSGGSADQDDDIAGAAAGALTNGAG